MTTYDIISCPLIILYFYAILNLALERWHVYELNFNQLKNMTKNNSVSCPWLLFIINVILNLALERWHVYELNFNQLKT